MQGIYAQIEFDLLTDTLNVLTYPPGTQVNHSNWNEPICIARVTEWKSMEPCVTFYGAGSPLFFQFFVLFFFFGLTNEKLQKGTVFLSRVYCVYAAIVTYI